MADFIADGDVHAVGETIHDGPFVYVTLTSTDQLVVVFTPDHHVDIRADL